MGKLADEKGSVDEKNAKFADFSASIAGLRWAYLEDLGGVV